MVNKIDRDTFMRKSESVMQEFKDSLLPFELKDAEGNYKSLYEILKYISSLDDPKDSVSRKDTERIADAFLKESYIVSATGIQEAFKKLNNE